MIWIVGILIFAVLLFSFPKAIISTLMILVIFIGGFIFYSNQQDAKRKKKRDAVVLAVQYDLETCQSDFPLLVSIKNNTDDIVLKIGFILEGHRQGYSDPIYSNRYSNRYSSDKIITSSEVFRTCWSLPKLAISSYSDNPKNLIWSVDDISPIFKNGYD